MAAAISLLYAYADFAPYAATGFLWEEVEGIVISTNRTFAPTIRFVANDGVAHFFEEDYIGTLCERNHLVHGSGSLLCAGIDACCGAGRQAA
jgi:hypothetical protein